MSREFLDTIYQYWFDNFNQIQSLNEQLARAQEGTSNHDVLLNLINAKQADRQRLDTLITLYCESFKAS